MAVGVPPYRRNPLRRTRYAMSGRPSSPTVRTTRRLFCAQLLAPALLTMGHTWQKEYRMIAAAIEANDLGLRWSATLMGGRLLVSYGIENRSQADVYVLDAMFELNDGPKLNPLLAYTLIEGDLLTLFRGGPEDSGGPAGGGAGTPLRSILAPAQHSVRPSMRPRLCGSITLRTAGPHGCSHNQLASPAGRLCRCRQFEPAATGPQGGRRRTYRIEYRQAVNVQRFVQTQPVEMTMSVIVTP